MEDQKGSAINVGKSGVIVVDTEKLIQNKQCNEVAPPKSIKNGKKSRKKKNKKQVENPASPNTHQSSNSGNKKMITLKNPIFQSFQNKADPPPLDKNDSCGPAAIFTNENGMVTIRSSRLQQSLTNGGVLNAMPIMSMPKLLPEMQKSKIKSNCYLSNHQSVAEEKSEIISPFNAQEILSGLPGIEITKVDKKNVKPDLESNKSCQTAQVSIIPASHSGEKFSFDKDDWLYGKPISNFFFN